MKPRPLYGPCERCGAMFRRTYLIKASMSTPRFCSQGCSRATGWRRTHGMRGTAEYAIWSKMRDRCNNINRPDYQRYGARGISVCTRWDASFEAFIADMGARPSPGHSLDRIDNDGNYEPGNVRWATAGEQARNRRQNIFVQHEGRRLCLLDACAARGVSFDAIRTRIGKGEGPQAAFDRPIDDTKRLAGLAGRGAQLRRAP